MENHPAGGLLPTREGLQESKSSFQFHRLDPPIVLLTSSRDQQPQATGMLLPRSLLLALTGAAAALVATASAADNSTTTTTTTAAAEIDGWFNCASSTFARKLADTSSGSSAGPPEAQCATFKAPLCYEGVCEDATNTQIDIFVKRIQAVADGKPNIFFMQGGPGAASPAMESAMTGVYALLDGNVNVYTVDHRGTGRSTKLDCVAAQAQTSGSPGGASVDATEVGNCAADLESKYGSDLASFSVTSAASDLKFFITNFLQGEQTFVYGVSYGTSLVERLIHLDTEGVAGYILDGIATSSGSPKKDFEYFSTWDPDFDEIGQHFLSFCETNQEDCGQFFKEKSVADTLKSVMTDLDSESYKCSSPLDTMLSTLLKYPAKTYPPAESLRQVLGGLFMDATLRNFIPVLTYRLARCNSDDIKVMAHFFAKYGAYSDSGGSGEDTFSSDLVYKIIVYSEFWETEPVVSLDKMYARYLNTTISSGSYPEVETFCVFSKSNDTACKDFQENAKYEASRILYNKDQYWNIAAAPPKDVSVLLMSSKMDPQTPHKYAEFLYKALDTKNKELITFDQATHGTLWSTPLSNEDPDAEICGMAIVASYVAVGGDLSKMDKSCQAKMPPVSFKVPDRLVMTWLNATSAVDGTYTGKDTTQADGTVSANGGDASSAEDSNKYKTVFIVFAVLFGVAIVAVGVVVVKWRRAVKGNNRNNSQNADYEVATP